MEWFEQYFCTHQLHSHFTRQCDQLRLPLAKTTMYQGSFGINATLQVATICHYGALNFRTGDLIWKVVPKLATVKNRFIKKPKW